jgi:transposase
LDRYKNAKTIYQRTRILIMNTSDDFIIRSSKLSLKFSNARKKTALTLFLVEYRHVVEKLVNIFWALPVVPKFPPKELTSKVETWFSARMLQCAARQASGIVRGCLCKQKKRLFIINKLRLEGKFKKARKLQKIYDEAVISRPNIGNIEAQLDSRFVKVDWNNSTGFDGWVTISSIGNKIKIVMPIRKSKHFNKLEGRGKIKSSIRLSAESVCFCFEIPKAIPTISGKTLGVDIGMIDVLACSDGQFIGRDCHGHSYQSICHKIGRTKKGGNGFIRAEKHRTNFLHWAINQLDFRDVAVLQRENIRDLRRFKRNTRLMQAWNYRELFTILDRAASESGVLIKKISPSYTSQRCSECGWTWKGNRKGKRFRCAKCGHEQDADLNASRNLSFNLIVLDDKVHQRHPGRTGFYWYAKEREPIVPVV